MDQAARRPILTSLPNILTYGRIAAVPVLVALMFFPDIASARWAAFGVFLAASITDWLDGYLARMWEQQSALGRMLDPIADKLLVGAALLMLVYDRTINGWSMWAAVIILSREILVSGLREFLAELNVKIHVTQLAKWKTAFQFIALAMLLAGPAVSAYISNVTELGILILWVAALLTLVTGYDYLKAGIRHAIER
ncbi:MAG TPA: CDP-diacylglycerol--glycerol-3-phosphate 3-phosphatidyltransferase [Hyphomicrobium sp.]|mgnify:FL=1|nr:CDP-diacylglycerol--glycerol-3-phosphate 3-phosphatidyltransferase [Hyphomicrobium sp.]